MAWYWWVLIIIGAVGIGYLKLKVLNKILEARKKKQTESQEEY